MTVITNPTQNKFEAEHTNVLLQVKWAGNIFISNLAHSLFESFRTCLRNKE